MIKRFYVIDQSYFRDDRLNELLGNHPEIKILIPDVAFVEMAKSTQWESTFRKSLQTLSQYASRCTSIISVSEAIRYEIKSKRSVDGHLTCREFTPYLRKLLIELNSGKDGNAIRMLRNLIAPIKRDMNRNELNHRK